MFSVDFLELVVIGGFQCAKPRHTPDFLKTCPNARTGSKKRTCPGKPGRMVKTMVKTLLP